MDEDKCWKREMTAASVRGPSLSGIIISKSEHPNNEIDRRPCESLLE